ncbi:ligand-binding sensor domain-containing protein, partial [Phocaeicola sp.]
MTRKIASFVIIVPLNQIMRRILILIYLTLSFITPAAAQLYQYLNTLDGLSSRRVISIQKDRKGYMWFLTHEGIDRYNGKQYVHYPLSVDGKQLKSFANLNTLKIDTTGVIWEIGKNGYIFKYNSSQDTYELVCNFANKDKSNSGLPLTATYIDNSNNIWLCTKNKQYIFDINSQELIRLNSSIEEEITCITEAGDNQYFLGTNHNIYCVKLENHQLQILQHEKLNDFHIVNYLYFHKNTQTLVIGTLLDGIFLYNIHSRQLMDIENGLMDINVNAIIANPKTLDEVLVATNGAGVYKLNLFSHQLSPYLTADHNHSNKMNGNIINDIYIDEDDKVWMAVYPVGITAYLADYPGYKWIQHSYDNPNSLIDDQVNYILEDSDGDIWYATNNGVCFYNRKSKQWRSILSSYQNDAHNQNHVFISLCESYPGKILVGGYMSGMYLIDKKSMTPHYFIPQITNGWGNIRPDKYIRCIYKDDEGMVWAGGYYNLKCYNTKTKEIDCYSMDFPVTYITSKDAHNLWIGTINGLYCFDKRNKTLKPVNLSSEIGCINTIYQDSSKITYIGTHGSGMWVYNNYTDKVTHYYSKNSALLSNNIYCILPYSDGNLIISTETELSRFKTKEKIFSNWTKEQGLMCGNFNPASGIHTRSGHFIFGSGDGAIELSDSINLPHLSKSKMVFSDFCILYQKVMPGDKNSPLTKEIDDTKSITLDHDQNIFSLNVSSINYDNPSNVIYSWKLEGFYDEWTTPMPDNLIRYTNISPGHYKLRVRAILMDDEHVLEERSI